MLLENQNLVSYEGAGRTRDHRFLQIMHALNIPSLWVVLVKLVSLEASISAADPDASIGL